MLDVPAYLARIDYSGATAPTEGNLRAIHYAHLCAVPFENLDIGLGRKIALNEDSILNKVVALRRGGFCYELNGAFAALLRALGFEVTLLSARVARTHGGEGPEFDHLTLRVDLQESWLADVGFGESFLRPLRIGTDVEQEDAAGIFRLIERSGRIHMDRAELDGRWTPQYSLSLQPRCLEEFASMCHFHQTSPDSSFTKNRICSRATPSGRVTLSGMKLIVTENDKRNERTLASEEEGMIALREQFGIAL
jgi:N-hydroxyarylamine O-acetyltransferase